ncbi:methyltransferase, partial [Trypanosoma cruzi]
VNRAIGSDCPGDGMRQRSTSGARLGDATPRAEPQVEDNNGNVSVVNNLCAVGHRLRPQVRAILQNEKTGRSRGVALDVALPRDPSPKRSANDVIVSEFPLLAVQQIPGPKHERRKVEMTADEKDGVALLRDGSPRLQHSQ